MSNNDRAFPDALRELHRKPFEYTGDGGIDFEPYSEFLSADDTDEWFRAWTGNSKVDGSKFLVFGQDGTGGYAAFWCVREHASILDQPVVFLGSEGERAIIARNFADYLWVLAGGYGPYEACAYPDSALPPHSEFTAFAQAHAPSTRKSPTEAFTVAQSEFPDFSDMLDQLCQ